MIIKKVKNHNANRFSVSITYLVDNNNDIEYETVYYINITDIGSYKPAYFENLKENGYTTAIEDKQLEEKIIKEVKKIFDDKHIKLENMIWHFKKFKNEEKSKCYICDEERILIEIGGSY